MPVLGMMNRPKSLFGVLDGERIPCHLVGMWGFKVKRSHQHISNLKQSLKRILFQASYITGS